MTPAQNKPSSTTSSTTSSKANSAAAALYRRIWRWHFYAGFFCLPFVLTLSVSGLIYLFKPQIDQWVERPFQHLEITENRHTPQAQIDAAIASLPGSKLVSYQLPDHEAQAVVINLIVQGEQWRVYLNPYNLAVLKSLPFESQFIRQVRTFHGELLAGNIGSVLVELAGCWAIILLVTGLYLWWPRNRRGLAGILYPRWRAGGRIFWRDIHAVTGIWIAAVTLFFLISALPWTLVWGTAFKEVRQWHKPSLTQDWSSGRSAERQLAQASGEHIHHGSAPMPSPVLHQAILNQAQRLNFTSPVEISANAEGNWKISSQTQNRPKRADAVVDAQNATLLSIRQFEQKPLLDRIIGIGVAAHEGQLFGWLNQLIGVLTALGLILISISGFIMWRTRKPDGRLGAPAAFQGSEGEEFTVAVFPKPLLVTLIFLALFLPLVGISVIVLLIFERAVVTQFPGFQRWLGITN
ncbi:PepSY domain-containing protein [Spongiibacter sp. KMU-158]|uniref:PepSY domain-containing protein n=1 Tax=Spongiibacter pelagi TaxID=2760804 RepID=A0A927C297_9GAMM|nr:PepSY domain-containing protein [Spongiibacter pelagi]